MSLSGRLLDAFLLLEETRRFSAAAERCHVTPSAFSQMISRLEELAGVRLFDRTTRRVELTPEGEAFLQGARRITAEMNAALSDLHERRAIRAGRLRVATVPSVAGSWLPAQISLYVKLHPTIDVKMWDRDHDQCFKFVADKEADLCLVNALPLSPGDFFVQHLYDEPFFVLCPARDELAARSSIDITNLKGRTLINMSAPGGTSLTSEEVGRRAGMRASSFSVGHFASLSGLVAEALGLGLIPKSAVDVCLRAGVVALPISTPGIIRPVYMARAVNRSLSIASKKMWDQIMEMDFRDVSTAEVTVSRKK